MEDIQLHTQQYEAWLGEHITLFAAELEEKHSRMASGVFPFLRATFYQWLKRWQTACPALHDAPVVLAIGDVHIENFGTWRDEEGRLIWGANDFDECVQLPWPHDLVSLAVSASLAIQSERIGIGRSDACDAILEGYTQSVAEGGRPFVLAELHERLRKIALGKLRDPVQFWEKLDRLAPWETCVR